MFDDFEFLEYIYSGGLAKRTDKEGVEALSDPERNILYAWWAKGEIDNGGFALLYAGPVKIDEVCTAFSEIGLPEAAHACLESKAAFLNGRPPEDQKQRLAEIDRLTSPDGETDPWSEQNKVIWGLEAQFDRAAASYVQRNIDYFERYIAP